MIGRPLPCNEGRTFKFRFGRPPKNVRLGSRLGQRERCHYRGQCGTSFCDGEHMHRHAGTCFCSIAMFRRSIGNAIFAIVVWWPFLAGTDFNHCAILAVNVPALSVSSFRF